jgi:hypothetical protein
MHGKKNVGKKKKFVGNKKNIFFLLKKTIAAVPTDAKSLEYVKIITCSDGW